MAAFSLYIRDRNRFCPVCGERGQLDFVLIREPVLSHRGPEREDIMTHYPDVRDYKCRNCDATFLLTSDGGN